MAVVEVLLEELELPPGPLVLDETVGPIVLVEVVVPDGEDDVITLPAELVDEPEGPDAELDEEEFCTYAPFELNV